MNRKNALFLTRGALIAALYFALCLLSAVFGLASEAVQCRFSEALCILPAFLPEAVPGLFLGCLLFNLFTGNIFDILIGSFATLIGALGTRMLRHTKYRFLLPLPTVIANSLLIPTVLLPASGTSFSFAAYFAFAGTVCIGECISALLLGLLLYRVLVPLAFFL